MIDPTTAQLRRFGALWTPIALALFARTVHQPMVTWPLLAFGVASIALALVRPRALRPVFVALTWLTAPLGWVVSRVLLAVVFFLVLTPLALFRRRRGDALGVRLDRQARTYWIDRPRTPRSAESYFRQGDE
ncbi:MAG: SxtJ family membrane protein [Polyangiales bacterium]